MKLHPFLLCFSPFCLRYKGMKPESPITYRRNLEGVNWHALKADLAADRFDNGRTSEQLRRSFANSHTVCFAWHEGRVIGKSRALSDGVCNAYIVDVWTHSAYRRRGIATQMMRLILADLSGQHVILDAEDKASALYARLGFRREPNEMSLVVGH